jgi:hypothetical protein
MLKTWLETWSKTSGGCGSAITLRLGGDAGGLKVDLPSRRGDSASAWPSVRRASVVHEVHGERVHQARDHRRPVHGRVVPPSLPDRARTRSGPGGVEGAGRPIRQSPSCSLTTSARRDR